MSLYDQVKVGDEVEGDNDTVYEVLAKKVLLNGEKRICVYCEQFGFYDPTSARFDNDFKPHKKVESYDLYASFDSDDGKITFYNKQHSYAFLKVDIKDGRVIVEG